LFELQDKLNKKIDNLSGGMKRRINLIAAIMHQPKILFLDEPTVGVDLQSKLIILDFLKNLTKDGTTIIYTSHHLMEAQELCDEVAIINYGQILKHGNPSELIHEMQVKNLEEVYIQLTNQTIENV
jgi:ABC-2 type transport system ATP-binding protein